MAARKYRCYVPVHSGGMAVDMASSNKNLGLYIHIPFCKAKCNYCDFNSHPGMEALAEPYFNALEKEADYWAEKLGGSTVTTVFIGGGTPSLVEPQLIVNLMDKCRTRFNILSDAETSIETNPGTLTFNKLKTYKEAGINRLSMGMQASQDRLLKLMGRIHSREEFDHNFRLALDAGFQNINLDLIFGLPGQTLEDWEETLKFAARPGVTHLSCYSLKIEEGTAFARRVEAGEITPADDELDRHMYWYAVNKLKENGFGHYEISNFALPGFQCSHNMIYWRAEEYIGLGAGAHAYVNGERFNNVYGIGEYISAMQTPGEPRENTQEIDRQESMNEYMLLGLRLIDGVSRQEFEARYGEKLNSVFGEKLERLFRMQLLEQAGDRLRLTQYGLDIANRVFAEFV